MTAHENALRQTISASGVSEVGREAPEAVAAKSRGKGRVRTGAYDPDGGPAASEEGPRVLAETETAISEREVLRCRVMEKFGEKRLDVRRFRGEYAGTGFNVGLRYLADVGLALRDLERAARKLGLLEEVDGC